MTNSENAQLPTDPVAVIRNGVHEARQVMREAADMIDTLRAALHSMVLAHENLSSDTDGRYPPLDAGCNGCTAGVTPDRFNTGLCAYHTAKKLLGHE